MKLTLSLAAATLALFTAQDALAGSVLYTGSDAGNSSFVYRGTSREAELAARHAEEERIASEQALKEMRAATGNIETPVAITEIDIQETASTSPDPIPEEKPEVVRTEDPVSGREVREISLEKQAPEEQLDVTASGPEASIESEGIEAPGANATTPADLVDDAASPTENTESPDSMPTPQ